MDGEDLALLIKIGEQLFLLKLFVACMGCLWVYDYFLTLGDEIKYAWTGRRSWIFLLFAANRYAPVLIIVWSNAVMFNYTKPVSPRPRCQRTKWLIIFYSTAVIVLAQIMVMIRIYVITNKNKLICAGLSTLIVAQICFGVSSAIRAAMHPALSVPEINLDVFKFCSYGRWRLGELLFVNISLSFDVFAFVIILLAARSRGRGGYPGVPSIMDTVLRDATMYFMLMFLGQIMSEMFTIFIADVYQALTGMASVIIIPIMASRLMISLRKAGSEPTELWSLPPINSNLTSPMGNEGMHFAPLTLDESHGISGTPSTLDHHDLELDSMPRLPREIESSQLR